MGVTDPRYATTLTEFIAAGKGSPAIKYPQLCFREVSNGISYTVHQVIDDYIYELKAMAEVLTVTNRDDLIKYQYRPKLLASDIYGSTDLYYVILRINDLANAKEFDFSNDTIRMLTKADMASAISKIFTAEKDDINTYNIIHS